MAGWMPTFETIVLTNGDWLFERTSDRGNFPPGTIVEIRWADVDQTVWPASIDADLARWRVESTTAALIPHGTAYETFVRYPNPTLGEGIFDDHVWRYGRAERIPNL